jgi:hypothetical protein
MTDALPWFERNLRFGHSPDMLPFFLERLQGTPLRAEAKVKGLPDELLSTKVDGKWSIKEQIGHLAEVDAVANKRLDEMAQGVAVLSPAVFEPQNYNPWPIERVLELLRHQRALNLAKYKQLKPHHLTLSSMHPRLKVPMTPVDLAWFDAEHDDHHLVKINFIIETLTSP